LKQKLLLKKNKQNIKKDNSTNLKTIKDRCELEIDWEIYNNFRTYNGKVFS